MPDTQDGLRDLTPQRYLYRCLQDRWFGRRHRGMSSSFQHPLLRPCSAGNALPACTRSAADYVGNEWCKRGAWRAGTGLHAPGHSPGNMNRIIAAGGLVNEQVNVTLVARLQPSASSVELKRRSVEPYRPSSAACCASSARSTDARAAAESATDNSGHHPLEKATTPAAPTSISGWCVTVPVPRELNQTAKSHIRLNQNHAYTNFAVRVDGSRREQRTTTRLTRCKPVARATVCGAQSTSSTTSGPGDELRYPPQESRSN